MLDKTIKYKDFRGNEREETFSFNLSKAEIVKMEMEESGGLSGMIKRISETQDIPALTKLFDRFICASYGVVSPDGRKFIKNEEVLNDFKQSNAYSELFIELLQNADKAAEFVNQILPPEAVQAAKEAQANKPAQIQN